MALLLSVLFVALVFEYINGFHDTANSIATVVSTKVLTPRHAIMLAAVMNLVGALWGTAVAKTVSAGLVDANYATTLALVCALVGAVLWNLLTWWFGLPSSSSHALVGGLCGATLASANGQWSALIWSKAKEGVPWYKYDGILYKVVVPMVVSPLAGFLIGMVFMGLLYILLRNWKPKWVTATFGKAQLLSAAYMGFGHGSNDAQKTMGIIALALAGATTAGTLDNLPPWARFLYQPETTAAVYVAQTRLAELQLAEGKTDPSGLNPAAVALLERAAAGKNIEAASLLGRHYVSAGKPEKAREWLAKAAKANEPQAQRALAKLLDPSENSPDQLFLRQAAATNKPIDGHAFIAPKLHGMPTNATDALAWLESKSNSGNGYAMTRLGVAHAEGKGVPKDDAKARRLWESAAHLGIPEAHLNLGLMDLAAGNSISGKKDAIEHFEAAAAAEGIKSWIKIVCAVTMACGTAAGGWRIIKTMGHKMVKLQAVHGFAAEATAATVLMTAAHFGMPVSTTHAITTSIMGVGCAKRFGALNLGVIERILWAWVLTLPVTALVGYALMSVAKAIWGPG